MNYLKKLQDTRRRQLDGVEGFLSDAFAPVSPSQDFVSYLGERLISYPQSPVVIRSRSLNWYQYTVLAIISILGGGVLLAMLIRMIITWVAWLSLARQLRRGTQA